MTLSEFNNEFELTYSASNDAPPLDAYERSVFLTQAQEKLVRSYYDSFKNNTQQGFETSEERRRELAPLVKPGSNNSPIININKQLSSNSRFFTLSSDVMYIIFEEAVLSSTDSCLNNKTCSVKPIRHDEFRYKIKNPFKKPSESLVFRLDNENNEAIELIPAENSTVSVYKYRYIKYPRPIVLENLSGGLSINGVSTATNSELPESMHRKIVNLAIELALETTGNPRLQSKVQINNKNEY